MAAPTVAQLVETQPTAEVLAEFLHLLETAGVDVTAWDVDTAAYAFAWASAAFFSDRTKITASIARSGFVDLATEDWLTYLSASHYQNAREPAVRTVGEMQLTPDASASLPNVIAAGDVVVKQPSTGVTLRNTTGATLTVAGTPVIFTFQAEVAGLSGNVPLNAQNLSDLELQTPIPGVTVSNPAITGTSDWKTTVGADQESDERLRTRNRTKWATLAYATGPKDAYVAWALEAAPSVTRVQVDDQDATATGNVVVYLASDTGGAAGAAVDAVDDYINGDAGPPFIPARKPICATVAIQSAVPFDPPIYVAGDLYVEGRYVDGIVEKVDDVVNEFFKTIPIGGFREDPFALTGKLYANHVYAEIAKIPGIQNVIFKTTVGILINGLTVAKGVVCVRDVASVRDWNVITV